MLLTVIKNLIQGQKKAKGSQFSHLHYCNVCRGAHFSICKTKVLLRNQAIQSRDTYIERWFNSLISNFNFGLGLFRHCKGKNNVNDVNRYTYYQYN